MFVLHPESAEEIKQVTAFYKQKQAGLEKRFIEALDDCIDKICTYPLRYRKVEGDVRKCRLLHFPYELNSGITIIRLMKLLINKLNPCPYTKIRMILRHHC